MTSNSLYKVCNLSSVERDYILVLRELCHSIPSSAIPIEKEAFGVLRHRDYPPEICLIENAKYFSWRAKLGYLTLREEHVINHIVTLQEQ